MNSTKLIACVGFQAEAFDSAADAFRRIIGWVVTVVQSDGTEPWDGTIMDLVTGDDGQYKVVIARFNEEAGVGDPNDTVTLDIYDDLDRVEVI